MEISNATIASSTELAGSVASNLTTSVLGLLVVMIGIAVGIFFLYWAVRKAMRAPMGNIDEWGNDLSTLSHAERKRYDRS